MTVEIEIPHDEIRDPQTITGRNIRAFKEKGLEIHRHEVTDLQDDFKRKVRVLKVKNTKYFDMGRMIMRLWPLVLAFLLVSGCSFMRRSDVQIVEGVLSYSVCAELKAQSEAGEVKPGDVNNLRKVLAECQRGLGEAE